MNIALLLILVTLAFIRVELGLAILLILTSSLFSLAQFTIVQLPLGNIEPTEAIVVAIFVRRGLDFVRSGKLKGNGGMSRALASAILPYVVWQTICSVRGAANWAGTDYLRYDLRFFLGGVLPWMLPFALLGVPSLSRRCLKLALWVAVATSVVHVIIQVTDYRSIMEAAYIPPRLEQEYSFVLKSYREWLDRLEVTRFYPQGIMLIVLSAIYMTGRAICKKITTQDVVSAGIVLLAIVITVERNFLFSALCGIGATLALSARYGKERTRRLGRGMAVFALLASSVAVYVALRPALLQMWELRIGQLSGADRHIFNERSGYRGLDNVASLRALEDHPVLGVGMPRYPSEYSIRTGPPTDIHPLLQVGLMGGVPAIILLLRLQWLLVKGPLKAMKSHPQTARDVIPFAAVLVVNCFVLNIIGAGGTTFGNSLVVLGVFIAAGWNECAARARTEVQMRMRYGAKDFDHHTIIQPGTVHRADDPVRA